MSARDSLASIEEKYTAVTRKLDAAVGDALISADLPSYRQLQAIDRDVAALALGAECLRLRRGHGRMTLLDIIAAVTAGGACLRVRPELLDLHVGDDLPQHVVRDVIATIDLLPAFVPGKGRAS